MTLPGFSEKAERTAIKIYCNKTKAASWYVRENDENTVVPPRLTGMLTGIETWEVKEGDYAGTQKINFNVTASGQDYSLTSGLSSAFARGLLGVVATAPAGTFERDITIAVRSGDKALLCSVYDSKGEWLKGLADWGTHDWSKITEQAIARFGGEEQPAPVEAVEDDGDSIAYEASFSFDDEQLETTKHRGQKEFSDSIVAMTKNSSAALGAELAEAATSLGICYGQLETNFENQLSKLKAAINQIRINAEKTGVSTDQIKKGLDAASGDCTLAVLTAYAQSIAPAKDLAEIPF